MIHSRYPLIGVNGKLNIAGICSSHSFIYSKFQQKKKRKKIQEILRYIFREGVLKKYTISAIGVKNFEASDIELERRQSSDFLF